MCYHQMNHSQVMAAQLGLALMKVFFLDTLGEDMPPCLIFRSVARCNDIMQVVVSFDFLIIIISLMEHAMQVRIWCKKKHDCIVLSC